MRRGTFRTWWCLMGIAALVPAMLLCPLPCRAQSRDERAVRAAYVFNLTRYVEWPAGVNELVIGVEGNRTTGEVLQKMLDGKSSDDHPIRVILFPSAEELKKCNILYIANQLDKKSPRLLAAPAEKNLLTVGETELFVQSGGMVGLVKTGDQIQIYVNQEATQRAGIKLSSRLLNLAVMTTPSAGVKDRMQ